MSNLYFRSGIILSVNVLALSILTMKPKRKLKGLLEKEMISGKSLTMRLRKQNVISPISKNDYNDLTAKSI